MKLATPYFSGLADVLEPPAPPVSAGEDPERQHPAPWWFRLAQRFFPDRCREIPEPDSPTWPDGSPRILLRQVSIWKRRWYLQQFACSEDPRFMHSHPAKFMVVLGLWGGYTEQRIAGAPKVRTAPYFFTMDAGHVHHVQKPGPGHTSLFLMFGIQHDDPVGDKKYFGAPVIDDQGDEGPATRTRTWQRHIKKKVARI